MINGRSAWLMRRTASSSGAAGPRGRGGDCSEPDLARPPPRRPAPPPPAPPLRPLILNVLWNIEQHRTGAALLGDGEGLVHRVGQFLHVLDQSIVLGDRLG